MKAWLHRNRSGLVVYGVALLVYCGASNRRLLHPSRANHYVYLAYSMLHGRLSLDRNPPTDDDWARIETLTLKDGRTVRGQFAAGSATTFLTTSRQTIEIPADQISGRKSEWYVSFPPFPAVLMLPVVALGGLRTNDVIFTIFFSALVPALLLGLLRTLRERGLSRRTEREDLWLVALFGVGSVFFFSAVRGEVWYTAHVIACLLVIGYAWCALEARRPFWAGVCLALGVATRSLPLLMLFPFFLLEVRRCRRAEWLRVCVQFAVPAAAIGLVLAVFNAIRFGSPFEIGHSYLVIRWAGRIQHWGLINYHFLSRNLAAAFTLVPKFINRRPYVQTSRDGLSLLITTPALLYLLWPREKPPVHRALWLTVLAVSVVSFMYHSDGYVQFGYRYSLDYMVFLVMLLALGGRPQTRTFRALTVFGILVNLFGALTFEGLGSTQFFDGFFPAE
ncbi:MAG TPA: glycosyltransferase 87 family protein [Polyangia bacterium]|nr:glycosyltransferase 87 family protein [Polyangia bacterium]